MQLGILLKLILLGHDGLHLVLLNYLRLRVMKMSPAVQVLAVVLQHLLLELDLLQLSLLLLRQPSALRDQYLLLLVFLLTLILWLILCMLILLISLNLYLLLLVERERSPRLLTWRQILQILSLYTLVSSLV